MSARPDLHLQTAATMSGCEPLIFLEEAGLDHERTHTHTHSFQVEQDLEEEHEADAYVALAPCVRSCPPVRVSAAPTPP